ncbi:hypothetical protein HGRIS_014271 [Hohenbuehelia grisea]|uniref:RRM domain-containing protein n=1 Tax=Hohenbuehelia grisea TaxID=104357 RepID=A0ABR3JTJ5_9AGAR
MTSESALGKRKQRDEETSVHHGPTLFVSNLPYNATSVDLQTLFSDFAPVKTAFIVTEQGTGVSKGVGYVSFALKEDAESTFEQVSKEGLAIAGRSLRVQWADQKPKEKGEHQPKESKPRPRVPHVHVPRDPDAVRTIIVSGLPASIDSKTLWKKIRKAEGAESVIWPVKEDDGSEDLTKAHVLFATPSNALKAIDKLHAHVYKGSLLSVALKKRLDDVSAPVKKPNGKGAAPAAGAPSRSSRLIVRNLPWNTTEQDLRAVFLPHGPIFSVDLPTVEEPKNEDEAAGTSTPRKARSKGFGFVWMVSRKDAERALEACNGITMRAGMAEELVSGKQMKKKQQREERKRKAAGEKEAEVEGDEDKQKNERVIAVDWALSKEKWKEEMAKVEAEADEDGDVEMASADGSEESEDDDSDSEGSELGVHHAGDDSDASSDSELDPDRSDDEEEPTKPQLPPPETGTTLFVRNVPFTATEDELRTLFRAFGPLRYARLTMDPESGRPRGTGFACFWNLEDADKAVAQSDLLRAEMTGASVPKKNPFAMPSILTPDPSSTFAQTLVLHGRTLDVVRAVTRDVAFKLKEDGQKKREKADKRNLYLLREGVILPNTPAAETLTPTEVERRTSSFNARRALLRSNPSLYISKTRLSVRQIPIFATERMLKRLSNHAVRAFKDDVKHDRRENLTPDELTEVTKGDDEDEGADPKASPKGKERRKLKHGSGVKQAKVVRQQERVDPVTGKGRSKGYGFVELYSHADALRVLRWANNNAEATKLLQEWWQDEVKELLKQERAKGKDADEARIQRLQDELEKGVPKAARGSLVVEFSIENIQVVHRRAAHQTDQSDATEKRPREKREKLSLPSKATKSEVDAKPSKKRRLADGADAPVKEEAAKDDSSKPANKIGSIIGRKRKQRKSKA